MHLKGCLASLPGADRIVVLDSGSTDRTEEIARRDPRVTWKRRTFTGFADQRNHGLETCFDPGELVLHLDADERMTPELEEEILAIDPTTSPAWNLASLTFLRGRPIPRASGYPVFQTRLSRAHDFRFIEVGHGQKAPPELGSLPRLRHPYEHHPFEKGLEEWRTRHKRYAQLEAEDIAAGAHYARWSGARHDPIARRQWMKRASGRLPGRPLMVFVYLMLLRGGVLDGPAGWEYCRRRAEYEAMVSRALRSLRRRNRPAGAPSAASPDSPPQPSRDRHP